MLQTRSRCARRLVQRCVRISAQEVNRRLEVAQWQQAWDRYTLAAVVVGQLSFYAATTYKGVVLEVASNARAEGRKPLLAMFYDELAR